MTGKDLNALLAQAQGRQPAQPAQHAQAKVFQDQIQKLALALQVEKSGEQKQARAGLEAAGVQALPHKKL